MLNIKCMVQIESFRTVFYIQIVPENTQAII